jgi:RNA polymerase sigma-70 factor (ECF subfamily)
MSFSPARSRGIAFATAYRILGDPAAAADIAQDCSERLASGDAARLVNPQAFVATMAARRALNALRDARARSAALRRYALPVPLAPGQAAEAETRLDLGYGLTVLGQALPPLARAVFILRSAFDLSYDEIGLALGRAPATCRKAHSRAMVALGPGAPAPAAAAPEAQVRRLAALVVAGDIEGLSRLLAAEVTLHSDGGGVAPDLGRPLRGRERIARFLGVSTQLLAPGCRLRLLAAPQGVLLLAETPSRLELVVLAEAAGSELVTLYAISDPAKLARLARLIPPR